MNLRDFFTVNSWWGKIIGAIFGYMSGGSIGAFFGIIVGNFFDKGLSVHFSNPHWLYHAEKRKLVQKIFFEATFSSMGYIAKADGRVSESEIRMAKLLMDEMRLTKDQKILAQNLFNIGKQSSFKIEIVLNQLQTISKDSRELLKLFVDIQYRAAQVDGLTAKKIKALDLVFTRLGFAPLHKQYRFYEDFSYSDSSSYQEGTNYTYEQQRQRPQQKRQRGDSSSSYQNNYKPQSAPDTLAHAYALLEVNSATNKSDVKRAYRRLLSKNHPDKLIAQGLPEEMIKIANDKTHRIMKAYEVICENKGW